MLDSYNTNNTPHRYYACERLEVAANARSNDVIGLLFECQKPSTDTWKEFARDPLSAMVEPMAEDKVAIDC